jgi:hypothetical protein
MAFNPNIIFSALSNLAGLLQGNNADTVGIFNANLQQVFLQARPLKAEIKETSQVMTHPVETGVIVADNHIINPIEINILLFINAQNYSAMYGQIKQAYVSGSLFSVQTRTGVYQNMVIADMPHTEDAEIYNGVLIGLHMKQVLYVVPVSTSSANAPANFNPSDPANTNTIQAGIKNATPISSTQLTQVQSIFTGLSFKALSRI